MEPIRVRLLGGNQSVGECDHATLRTQYTAAEGRSAMSNTPCLEMLTGEAREALIANFRPDEMLFEQNQHVWEFARKGGRFVFIGSRTGYLWKPSNPQPQVLPSDNLAETSRADTLVPSVQEDR